MPPTSPSIRVPDPDALIAALAARQHGVVSRAQLLEAGIGRHVIGYRMRRGRLRRVHRGVYQVGPLETPLAREMAALLACGREAALCDGSAGLLWRLLKVGRKRRREGPIDVWIRPGRQVHRSGIRIRRRKSLDADEVTEHQGLRVTTPARTLLDLAGSVPGGALERAVARADRGKLADREDLRRLLKRHPRAPGVSRLRAILALDGGPALTRSEAEAGLLDLIRKARLPTPEANVRVAGIEVDFYWPTERLVAEMDGFDYHASRSAFEWDRKRDGRLATAGIRFLRVTWRRLVEEPEAVVADLSRALSPGGDRNAR